MKKLFVFALCFGLSLPAAVCAGDVPHVLSFQSLFFDDGGNPIADGDIGATFKIIDTAGAVLYEEHQTLRAAGGFASALVGNGIAASGAPAGPIPASIFDADGPFYLEVQLDGESPMQAMEIASVPFAMKSEIAGKVADGAIETKAIADGGISFEDISAKAVDEIAKAVTGGRDTGTIVFREDLETMYRTPSSAASIGVKPNFIYSGSNNLQDVLTDFDRSIKARDERVNAEITNRNTAIVTEVANRNTAITGAIATEVTGRNTAIAGAIGTEVTNRNTAIAGAIGTEVTNRNTAIAGAIGTEVTNRNTAIAGAIGTEVTNRNTAIAGAIGTEVTNRNTAIDGAIVTEVTNRNAAIAGSIATEVTDRNTAIAAAEARANLAVADENTSRTTEINSLAPRLISAWGSVNPVYQCDIGGDGSTFSGLGVGAVYCECRNGSSNLCDVTFATPMASTAYVLVVTPSNSMSGMLITKAAEKFTIQKGEHISQFDFIVMGP